MNNKKPELEYIIYQHPRHKRIAMETFNSPESNNSVFFERLFYLQKDRYNF